MYLKKENCKRAFEFFAFTNGGGHSYPVKLNPESTGGLLQEEWCHRAEVPFDANNCNRGGQFGSESPLLQFRKKIIRQTCSYRDLRFVAMSRMGFAILNQGEKRSKVISDRNKERSQILLWTILDHGGLAHLCFSLQIRNRNAIIKYRAKWDFHFEALSKAIPYSYREETKISNLIQAAERNHDYCSHMKK
jgi:hypothetical protein